MASILCYRGVARGNPQYENAVLGRAVPRGGAATPAEHNLGDTESDFTSWTTRRSIALEKAMDSALGGRGVVLEYRFDEETLIASPDFFGESEVLVRGPVSGAAVVGIP